MPTDQDTNETAGVAGVWMLFVMMVAGSILSLVFMVMVFGISFFSVSAISRDLPSPVDPFGTSTPGSGSSGFEFVDPDVDFLEDSVDVDEAPDTDFGDSFTDEDFCRELIESGDEDLIELLELDC